MNVNIIILGNQGVGKTTILDSFIEKQFVPSLYATLGIDTKMIKIQNKNELILYNYFDTEGSEKDNTTNLGFIAKADGIILIYDGELSKEQKKTDLEKWQHLIEKYCDTNIYNYVWLVCNVRTKDTIINIEEEKKLIKTFKLKYLNNLVSVILYQDHTHSIQTFFATVNNSILEKDSIKNRMEYKNQNNRKFCIIY